MHIKILKSCLINGKTHGVNSVAQVNQADGNYLIAIGKALGTAAPVPAPAVKKSTKKKAKK